MRNLLNRFKLLLPSNNKLQNTLFVASFLLFLLYCFSIPTFSNRYPFNYLTIGVCVLMCVAMLAYVLAYSCIRIDLFIALLFLFNLGIVLTHLINNDLANIPKVVFLMSGVAFVVYEFNSSLKYKNLIPLLIFIAGLLFAFVYVVHYRADILNIKNIFSQRLGSFFDNENEIGKEFGFFGCLAIAFAIKQEKIGLKIFFAISTALFLFLILTTGSISNLLTFVVVSVAIVVATRKTWKWRIISLLIFALAIGLFFALIQIPGLEYFKDRIYKIFDTFFNPDSGSRDGSAYDRLYAMITSFKAGFNRLIFGFGYMSATDFTYAGAQAHNNFAELFIDFGLFGFLIYEALLLIPSIFASYKKEKLYCYAIILFMFLFQFFLTTYYKKFEYIFFAYIFSIHLVDSKRVIFIDFKKPEPAGDPTKKKIFEIIPSLSPVGGAESFVANFSIELKKKYDDKYEIYVVLLYEREPNFVYEKLTDNGIKIIQLHKERGIDLVAASELRHLIKQYKPAIIHTHLYALTTTYLALLCKKNRPKIVHTIHHNFPVKQNWQHKLLIRLIKRKWLTPICVAKVPSDEYGQFIKQEIGYINNGVNLNDYNSTKPLADRDIDLLMVGRFVAVKNHKYLLDICNNQLSDFDYKMVVLGDGELYDETVDYVNKNNLAEKIEFKGSVNNVNDYMADSKILVMPSANEGNPMVINEAFASGMIVVGNDVGGIHDLLVDKNNCTLVAKDDADRFANAIKDSLLKINKGKIKTNKVNLSDISIEKTVEKYMEVFGNENV